jgi:predicted RNA-binding Zn ribbon-like protein
VAHRAANFEEAEAWDLDFWQRQSPEQRLSAFLAIRRDVDKVMKARSAGEKAARKDL